MTQRGVVGLVQRISDCTVSIAAAREPGRIAMHPERMGLIGRQPTNNKELGPNPKLLETILSKKKLIVMTCALAFAGMANLAVAAEPECGPACSTGAAAGKIFIRGEVGGALENDRWTTALTVRGGYWFNQNFAVEGSFTRLDLPNAPGNKDWVHRWGIGVVGKKTFGDDGNGFYISGRAGIAYEVNDNLFEDNKFAPAVGVGVGYDFNDRFGIDANYDNSHTATVGAEWRF